MKGPSNLFLTIGVWLLNCVAAFAQTDIPVGDWQTHYSYRKGQTLAITGSWIYYGADNGFLRFDPIEKTPQILSKIDGFNDTGIGALAYENNLSILAIGYKNGNMDFLTSEGIINQDAILKADLIGDKDIHHISFYKERAYISTAFGVVVINLDNFDLRESYINIAPGGEEVSVAQSAFFNDSIFIATDKGILAGSTDVRNNLLDYNNWHQFGASNGLQIKAFKGISSNGNDLSVLSEDDSIFNYVSAQWMGDDRQLMRTVNSINYSGDKFLVCAPNLIEVRSGAEVSTITTGISNPNVAAYDDHSVLWISDFDLGFSASESGSTQNLSPNSPHSDRIFSIYSAVDKQIVLSGAYDHFGNGGEIAEGFYLLVNGQWTNYNPSGLSNSIPIPNVTDLVDVSEDGTGNYYFASFGSGILQWDGLEGFTVIDNATPGSTLQPSTNDPDKVEIAGIKVDEAGSIWMTNHNTYAPLQIWDGANEWQVINPSSYPRYPFSLTLDETENKWMSVNPISESGLLVVDDQEGVWRNLTTQNNNGDLPSNQVTAITPDLEGSMWIGTAEGVVYFPNPNLVLSYTGDPDNPLFQPVNAVYPVFEGRVLLKDEYITAITVDPGNRKWIGTKKGVWLFSATGDALFSYFNTDNSPLPSNVITAIGIDETSGVVYIGTDRGLVSYRGTSTRGEDKHQNVKIFPNPVKPGFSGLVSISGLVNDAIVKITDVSGKVVYETRAYGGTATWNASNYNGIRATTGMYLVFSSDVEGNETFVGKIAIVN